MNAVALDLRSIARALGGDVTGGQVLAPGPGHSPRDRSLAIRLSGDSPFGFIAHSHAGDDWRECRDHVLSRLGVDTRRPMQPAKVRTRWPSPQPTDRSRGPIELWREAVDPRKTLVETYLGSRGLVLPSEIAGSVLRFHDCCPWQRERVPAMVAAFRSIATDELVAVHRTALSADGEKMGRKMLGPVAGAAIKLDADEAVTTGLHLGEGVETCLAARQLGFKPTWALGSAGAIAAFPALSGIESLSILAESDDGGANARAIEHCGNRWVDAGREVIVIEPRCAGDVNDALRRAAA
jgi:hypothetical protein